MRFSIFIILSFVITWVSAFGSYSQFDYLYVIYTAAAMSPVLNPGIKTRTSIDSFNYEFKPNKHWVEHMHDATEYIHGKKFSSNFDVKPEQIAKWEKTAAKNSRYAADVEYMVTIASAHAEMNFKRITGIRIDKFYDLYNWLRKHVHANVRQFFSIEWQGLVAQAKKDVLGARTAFWLSDNKNAIIKIYKSGPFVTWKQAHKAQLDLEAAKGEGHARNIKALKGCLLK